MRKITSDKTEMGHYKLKLHLIKIRPNVRVIGYRFLLSMHADAVDVVVDSTQL